MKEAIRLSLSDKRQPTTSSSKYNELREKIFFEHYFELLNKKHQAMEKRELTEAEIKRIEEIKKEIKTLDKVKDSKRIKELFTERFIIESGNKDLKFD